MTTTFPRTMGYGLGSSIQRGTSAFGPWVSGPDPYDYPMRDQTMTTAPAFPPFKFEPRRARIDWRLLHGIDINAMVRDVDLDTLEKIVNIVAFGDIEAEDTRHLTELNFIKIFRLSQMMIEYLLYVQDCLQSSNTWLQQDRGNMDKYVQAARLRIRELEANLKMNKRELRRTRKTVKTYELLAVLNDGKGNKTGTGGTFGTTAAPSSPPQQTQQQQQTQAARAEANAAMEAMLRKELASLGERLSKVTLECQTVRAERDDLYQAVKDLEAVVKARPREQDAGYSRPNAEAMQTIQGLQDQLNRATAEITKLRSEKEDLVEELDRTNTDKRQLHEEKSRLLAELAARPDTPKGASESYLGGDNLGTMLQEAEKQKAAIQDQLADARAEITALQKQLMKAMKATAMVPPDELLVRTRELEGSMRELEAVKANLEREMGELRRTYDEDVQQLQEDLQLAQRRMQAAEKRVAELQAGGAVSPQRTGSRMDSPGGLVKMQDGRQGGGYPDPEEHERLRVTLSEYEAVNERMNQQLAQLKEERNTLASEVEQLRAQSQGRSPQKSPGDQAINRDWRIEEMERLKADYEGLYRRNMDLEDALRDRDSLIERLRNTIRELQAQLDERIRRDSADQPSLGGRVKQQVAQYESLAVPARQIASQSFSFIAEDPGSAVAETPTARKTHLPDHPPRSHSPILESTPEGDETDAVESPSPEFPPPSPRRPEHLLDPSAGSRWLRRTARPSPAEASLLQQSVLRRVAGMKPETLELRLMDEIRVITENPYPYEGDEEQTFKSILPYELEERPGVRSVRPHALQDLELSRRLFTDQLLAVVDDELAQFGVDLESERLTDKAYAACMEELADRRSQNLSMYPRELRDRATSLREYLLTHLELARRAEWIRRAMLNQEQLQMEQRRTAGADSGSTGTQIRAPESPAGARQGSLAAPSTGSTGLGAQSVPSSGEGPAPVSGAGSDGNPISAAAAAARKPLSMGGGEGPASPARPAFSLAPQISLREESREYERPQQSSAAFAEPQVVRVASDVVQIAPSQRSQKSEDVPISSTRISSVGSMKDLGSTGTARVEQPSIEHQRSFGSGSSKASSHDGERPALRQQSLPRSASSSHGPAASAGASHVPSPKQPSREASGAPMTVGHAPPPTVVRPMGQAGAAAAATAPGGNMNMSIRSVKYQESDFDDEEDEQIPLAQPKPVRRVVDDDEYALTDDEAGQHDMGLEETDDFSPMGQQPKILMRPTTSAGSPTRLPVPSRLGTQPTPAVAQSRGWATDEPLQPAPVKRVVSPQRTETAELEELESIHSFDNSNSQSLQRPGAWGSPGGTMRKQSMQRESMQRESMQREAREPSRPLSRVSKQSGWNETIKSFGAQSGHGDEIHSIQEISGVESFTDSIRQVNRGAAQRGPTGASQAAAAAPAPRQIQPRRSFSSELSDIEYA